MAWEGSAPAMWTLQESGRSRETEEYGESGKPDSVSPKGVTLEESNGLEAQRGCEDTHPTFWLYLLTQVDTHVWENKKSSLREWPGLREVQEEERAFCEKVKNKGDWFAME